MKTVAMSYAVALALAVALAFFFHAHLSTTPTTDGTAGFASGGVPAERDVARLERQLVPRLHARSKRLRIGTPDCSRQTNSDVYYRICYLPVDGAEVPVGLRYDDGERIIPHVLWSVINLKDLARSASVTANMEYGAPRRTVICKDSGVVILPSGARLTCRLRDNRADRAVSFLVIHPSDPFPVLVGIAGLHLKVAIAGLRAEIARRIPSSHTVPGRLVWDWYEGVEKPSLNALYPHAKFGKMWCGPTIDVESLNNFCALDSRYGTLRVGVTLDPNKQIRFYWLSLTASRKRLESAGTRYAGRMLAVGTMRAGVRVDCGTDDYITLSLPSVHYCSVVSSGRRAYRLGVEYYERVEGIHFVVEKQPA